MTEISETQHDVLLAIHEGRFYWNAMQGDYSYAFNCYITEEGLNKLIGMGLITKEYNLTEEGKKYVCNQE